MRSLLISGIRQVGLIEEKVPVPQDGEVLLKINYVGFCGSDLNTFLGKNPMVKMPVIPGTRLAPPWQGHPFSSCNHQEWLAP